jgi:hypothetical protein
MSAEEWLVLVVLLQRQSAICVAREDRRFLAEMANVLVLDDPPPLQPWQKKWILAVKKECRL